MTDCHYRQAAIIRQRGGGPWQAHSITVAFQCCMLLKKYLHSLTKYAAINHVEEEQCSGESQRGSSLSFHKKQQREIGNNYSHCHFVEEKHPLVSVHICGSERTVPVMWS